MSDEYRSWSKNPFVSSNNRTPHWRIFKNFPNNVKVWYNILSFAILFIKKVSISVFESFKYVETSNNCLLHSLITSDLSAFAGPRFLSVSLMTWILFFSVTNLWSARFSFPLRLVLTSKFYLVFNKFNNSISELPAKFINLIICVFSHKTIF